VNADDGVQAGFMVVRKDDLFMVVELTMVKHCRHSFKPLLSIGRPI
jgi:hypothetical protein